MWMAGGGVKGGRTIGVTDEVGLCSVGERYYVHDVHPSMLDLLGPDHERLTYTGNGRGEHPTITSGAVIENLTT